MASPSEKLAESLEILRILQDQGMVAIRTSDLSRTHRERLHKNGFLQYVMKGWYISAKPDDVTCKSTAWYASYWDFCSAYLNERFGTDWCLSPEQSLLLHVGNLTVPHQLLVRTPKGGNKITKFPHNTSLLDARIALPNKQGAEEKERMRLFSLPSALIACSPQYFRQSPTDARAALSAIQNASEVLEKLLEGGHSTIAGRLAGAFRNIGRDRIAEDILKTMRTADYNVRESDPFEARSPVTFTTRELSPYVNRIRLMWQDMREPIIERFPKTPDQPENIDAYLKNVDDVYVTDAYHSLSIEGYRVSRELIERVRDGTWRPDKNEEDREQKNALAARGYYQAFQSVKKSVHRILSDENSGTVVDEEHGDWYREMFGPSIAAGIHQPADLAGYRNSRVRIDGSMHTPPNHEAVRDLMPAFFDLLRKETEPSVRIVLGHFIFVYIHPYTDGNGRTGRFLMNAMLASGGYPWTVVPLEKRDIYMAALEEASVNQNIVPFADFLAQLVVQD